MEDQKHQERDELSSIRVRAGKRTYFFDVRSTRNHDHFLTITESKRIFKDDGSVDFIKHKLFLYKEDFEKFKDALDESIEKVDELNEEFAGLQKESVNSFSETTND